MSQRMWLNASTITQENNCNCCDFYYRFHHSTIHMLLYCIVFLSSFSYTNPNPLIWADRFNTKECIVRWLFGKWLSFPLKCWCSASARKSLVASRLFIVNCDMTWRNFILIYDILLCAFLIWLLMTSSRLSSSLLLIGISNNDFPHPLNVTGVALLSSNLYRFIHGVSTTPVAIIHCVPVARFNGVMCIYIKFQISHVSWLTFHR